MHTFQPRWDERSTWEPPSIEEFRFAGPYDVIRYCELDRASTVLTYPELWHLDDTGRFRCYSKGSSFDSVQTFADYPAELLECRTFDRDDSCPNRWVIVEPRHPWQEWYVVSEADAAAFARLRHGLVEHGHVDGQPDADHQAARRSRRPA